uniref:Uncharacterized protein n=1 Tax=uncultured bacterium contig00055 TaxID=1181539 RepID=A0A806KKA1_9BACT|nr:hypothetical protein [uncultured bacterium contig00055]
MCHDTEGENVLPVLPAKFRLDMLGRTLLAWLLIASGSFISISIMRHTTQPAERL